MRGVTLTSPVRYRARAATNTAPVKTMATGTMPWPKVA
jgi:hypothetical protein